MTQAPRIVQAHALDYCAAAAAHLLAEREARYPRQVEKGTMTAEAAEAGLAMMRAIVAQWRWVIDPTRPPAPAFDPATGDFGVFNYRLAAEMTKVAAAARSRAQAKPGDFETAELADLCEALAWYQHDIAGTARIVLWTSIRRKRARPEAERQAA